MRVNRRYPHLTVFALTLLIFAGGCALFSDRRGPYGPQDPETNVPKTSLPKPLGKSDIKSLQLSGKAEEGHARPKVGASPTAPSVSASTTVTAALSPEEEDELQKAAAKDPRVIELLGQRYFFIEGHPFDEHRRKGKECCAPAPSQVRLTFYSYSNKVAVEVRMKDKAVVSATRREGYMPPEGEQEVKEAAELAGKDSRIKDQVQGLEAHALLWEPEGGLLPSILGEGWSGFFNDPGYGRRVFLVTFERGKSGKPLFWAIVDVGEQKVLRAGEEPKR